MKKILLLLICCIFGSSYGAQPGIRTPATHATPPPSTQASQPVSNKYLIGYFPNWLLYPVPKRPKLTPADVQGDTLTHINYAFAKPYTTDANRNVTSYRISLTDPWADIQYTVPNQPTGQPYYGNFIQLKQLKQRYPHLKTLISIGGWQIYQEGSPAPKFSIMAASPNTRTEFINSCLEFCAQYDFDGIDIDWEFPAYASVGGRPEDTQNFTTLLRELYTAAKNTTGLKTVYDRFGKPTPSNGLLVTIAAPAGYTAMQGIQINNIHQYVDWINIMAYDFFGQWDSMTNHNAPLYPPKQGDTNSNIRACINNYKKAGVPYNKLVLGMPLYGRSFAQATSTPDGLFSTFSGPGEGTAEPGVLSISDILQNYVPSYTRHFDQAAQVPYLYNAQTKQFISFDDNESLKLKAQWAKKLDFAGAMVWQLENTAETWQALRTIQSQFNQ